ncbi:hypothetical protein VP1G_05885 [Cytospora mali]|uniref:Major facilitator superfamily (MFS) profile domain-containing protein n=1 Tax=Cytospora mali TaxID=578113 RepID=A0A194V3Y6_CYTMA|nr:hypothetical protein VP1G_05885 [Valsa mali var. pyri (nom. inval.)]
MATTNEYKPSSHSGDDTVGSSTIDDSPSPTGRLEANEKQEETQDEQPPRDIDGWKWWCAMTAILLSIFLYALDNTIVADIQATIIEDLGGLDKLSWLSVGFLLSATATNMVWGRLYGQFNSKKLYIFNVFLFEVGSAICGAAPNIDALIVGRAICGVGGSGLYVGVMTLIAQTTTIPERPLYVSGTGLTWGVGIVLGPVIGGAFGESSAGWRWAFYINLLIGAVCAPAWLFLLPSKNPRPGVPFKERAAEMDYTGMVLLMGALTSFFLALNWGGVTYPWGSGRIIGLFVCSGVLFIILGIQQTFTIFTTVARRIIPVQFFKSRTVLILFAVTAAAGASAFVPIYMIPIFFQFTRSDGPLDAGVRLLPLIVVMVVMIFVNGALLSKLGYYMPWYTLVLMGAGVGMWLQASFSVAQAVVSPENLGACVGFITLAQFAGITFALAIANTVFLNDSKTAIARILPDVPLSDIQAAMLGASSDFVKSLDTEQQTAVLKAVVSAIDKTYVLVIAAGSLVAVLSFFMKREKLFTSGGVGAA